MSIHGASHIKCVACDSQASVTEARSQWWICTTCGSYICQSCRALYLETRQGTCPGTIARGVDAHPPHFTRFLRLRRETEETESSAHSTVVLLGDVPRQPTPPTSARVIILDDDDAESDSDNDRSEP